MAQIEMRTKSMTSLQQNPGQLNDPTRTGLAKPFLSMADESCDGSGELQEPSRKNCLVIEKQSCRIYTKCK